MFVAAHKDEFVLLRVLRGHVPDLALSSAVLHPAYARAFPLPDGIESEADVLADHAALGRADRTRFVGSRKRPDDPFLLVDWLLKVLVRTAKTPVLVLFDEVQELATVADGENVVSAIRSAITKSKSNVRVVFTGSSQEKLPELFSRSRAALYEGASTLQFPHLGEDFIAYMHSGAGNVSRSASP